MVDIKRSYWVVPILSVLYFALGYASFLTVSQYGIVTPVVFLPEGLALAIGILVGPQAGIGVFFGQLALAVSRDVPWMPATLISMTNAFEIVLGWWLSRRLGIRAALRRRSYGKLMLMIYLVLQPFSATFGVAALYGAGMLTTRDAMVEAWTNWWIGNALAQSLIVPLLLAAFSEPEERIRQSARRVLMPALLLVPAFYLTFFTSLSQQGATAALLLFAPLLLWVAGVGGIALASLATVGLVMAMLFFTGAGYGPFLIDGHVQVFQFNTIALALALVTQIFSLVNAERHHAMSMLRKSLVQAQTAWREADAARAESERSNAAKGRFLTFVSHELRTPLNAILGFSQLMAQDPQLDAKTQSRVAEVYKAGQHLLELINGFLDISRIEAGKISLTLQPVNVRQVVDDCLRIVSPLVEAKAIQVSLHVNDEDYVQADITRLRQVLLNLLSNAVKYTPEEGKVRVTTEAVDAHDVKILLKDSGAGIPAHVQVDLFQPFHRGTFEGGNIEGAGMGLNISKQLVELMRGSIGLDSEPGKGSLFWIELPRAQLPVSPAP